MLIETELLVPTLADGVLQRPALLASLDHVERQRLALVEAPAGFSKTTLLVQWTARIKERGSSVAWFSAEPSDNRIDRLLTYFIGALRQADPEFPSPLPALGV